MITMGKICKGKDFICIMYKKLVFTVPVFLDAHCIKFIWIMVMLMKNVNFNISFKVITYATL